MPRALFTLAVLCAINALNFFDRQILPAVQESIKGEWGLSDSDLGWLNTAFILLYAFAGVPFGRLADLWKRKWILGAGVFLWSLLTALSGLAWSFWSLFLFRLGVGIGEASCAPAASSLIGDLFPPSRRARAMALFMLGLPIGVALSFIASSAIAERSHWRAAFFIAGLPGLALAAAAFLLADPPREGAESPDLPVPPPAGPSLFQGVRQILRVKTLWWIILSGAVHNFNMYAMGSFIASLFFRYHGESLASAGQICGLVLGPAGALGMYLVGLLGDRAYRKGVRGRLQVAWLAAALAVPFFLLALEAPEKSPWQFTGWLLPAVMLLYAYYGTVYAAIQDVVEPQRRGTAMAVYFCAMYLLGGLFGPVATGWLSDHFAARAAARAGVTPELSASGRLLVPEAFRATGLHQAFYAVPILCAVLALILFAASRTVTADHERLQTTPG